MSNPNFCEATDNDEVDCLSCEDNGFTTTPGGMRIPCFDCKMGDLYLYHDRQKTLAAMVHVDDGLGEVAEKELAYQDMLDRSGIPDPDEE